MFISPRKKVQVIESSYIIAINSTLGLPTGAASEYRTFTGGN